MKKGVIGLSWFRVKRNLAKLMPKGRAIFLAYDQGLEHGPVDFNSKNVDPNFIIDIAKKGNFSAVIFQKGIASKYNKEIKASGVPLVVKLNGKTSLRKGEPISRKLCTVEEAIALGAKAVGFTIYLGSEYEPQMMQEFEDVQRAAHKKGLPVILWMYPRGKSVKGKKTGELMAYATRTALEIGADVVKIVYNGKKEDLAWAIKSAGKVKVVVAGGIKTDKKSLYKQVKEIMAVGASGLAIGRNVWQDKKPLEISKKLRSIVLK